MQWLLSRLTALGFPARQPLPAIAGKSRTIADGVLWELVAFLPGSAVGWWPRPPIEEIGVAGRYHATAEQIRMPVQRPSALPLAEVPGVLLSALEGAGLGARHSAVIRQHAERLARASPDIAPMERER